MTGFYNFLEEVMPLKRILISFAIGLTALAIVLYSGLTSEVVRSQTVAARAFSAFSFTGLLTFIILMSCEEYAIFKTKRELEHFIDDAPCVETDEDFNRAQYFDEPEDVTQDNSAEEKTENISAPLKETFQPLNFNTLSEPK